MLAALLIATPALVGGPRADASGGGTSAAVAWLRGSQNGDGGFGFARGEESSPAMTGWAVLGLEAAGVNPLDVDHGDATPIGYLAGTVGQISTTGDIERTILLLRGAGLDPRHFQGHDLVSRLLARRGGDGSWAEQVNPTAFGILALKAAGATGGNSRSASWLRSVQNERRRLGVRGQDDERRRQHGGRAAGPRGGGQRSPASGVVSRTCAACSDRVAASPSPAGPSTRSRRPGPRRACSRRGSPRRRCGAGGRR